MPKKAIDYSKTVMYKIVCKDLNINDLYVGSTRNFIKRKSSHKQHTLKLTKNSYLYSFIRENGNWNNWEMIEIEKYPCHDGNEARKREREWFEKLNATLNVRYPERSDEEYRESHKEHAKEYNKQHEKSDARKAYNQLKWHCDICNCDVRRHDRSTHLKSQKHVTNINQLPTLLENS